MEVVDLFDDIGDLINEKKYKDAMKLYVENDMVEELHFLANGLVYDTESMKIYLSRVENLHPDDFSSMICRCIENNLEETLRELLKYGKSKGIACHLFLLIPKKQHSEPLRLLAKEAGYIDPGIDGIDVYPDTDLLELKGRYRGYRHAYHVTLHGDRKNKDVLIERIKRGIDCSFEAVCDALQIECDRGNIDEIIKLLEQ